MTYPTDRPSALVLAARARRPLFAQLFTVALALFAASCSGATEVCSQDDPLCGPGSDDTPVFPTVAQAALDALCIRGEAVPTTTKNGSVTSADCLSPFGDGYVEGWRVRVGSNASVTFETTSDFDTLLEVFRVDNPSDMANSRVSIAFDDDGGVDLNSRLTTPLVAGTEYLVMVEGFDEFEQGPYTLSMTAS